MFDSRSAQKAQQARASLAALFGEGETDGGPVDDAVKRAEDLFK
jgi:hypothetical protein